MKKNAAVVICGVLLWGLAGCSYHRAYISYSEYEEDVAVAAAGFEGRRLGTVRAGEGGALWERCTDVAEGSLWILMEDARRMGGNAIGEISWVPQDPNRSTGEPTCKKKWGWFLVWPVLVTPGFMSAKVEADAYDVPEAGVSHAGLYLIPEDPEQRAELARRLAAEIQ